MLFPQPISWLIRVWEQSLRQETKIKTKEDSKTKEKDGKVDKKVSKNEKDSKSKTSKTEVCCFCWVRSMWPEATSLARLQTFVTGPPLPGQTLVFGGCYSWQMQRRSLKSSDLKLSDYCFILFPGQHPLSVHVPRWRSLLSAIPKYVHMDCCLSIAVECRCRWDTSHHQGLDENVYDILFDAQALTILNAHMHRF